MLRPTSLPLLFPGFQLGMLLLLTQLLSAQKQPNADDLLRQMTLEEKIAQLSQMPGFPVPEFMQQIGATPEETVKKYGAG